MDLKQLRYFYTIANEGQITKAAKILHMAQPPLSLSLKNLEEELGVKLFERSGKRLELTQAGRVLYRHVHQLIDLFEDAVQEVREIGEGLRGNLSIGSTKTLFYHLPEKLKTFKDRFPNVTFELLEGDSYYLSKQLIDRTIDLALVRLPLNLDEFSFYMLPKEKYKVAMPEQWAKAFDGIISIFDILEFPLMLLHRINGIGQYEIILDAFHKRGLEPEIICECPDVDMLLGLVAEQIGITIIPENTSMKFHQNKIQLLEIMDASIISESAIIWLKQRYLPKSAQHFLELFFDGEMYD